MHIVNRRGLTPAVVRQLDDSLQAAAKDMVGREMIYDLADHVRAFLVNHNAPPPEGSKLSFHEQMVKRMENDKKVGTYCYYCTALRTLMDCTNRLKRNESAKKRLEKRKRRKLSVVCSRK